VGHLVAAMFNAFELLDARLDLFKVIESALQEASAIAQIAGHVCEKIKEPGIARYKTNHLARRSSMFLLVLTNG
jgi:hypothetical protein